MQLREFVAESLKQIIDGVADVQPYAESRAAFVNPGDLGASIFGSKEHAPSIEVRGQGRIKRAVQFIEFDIAVVVSEDVQTKGGAGLLTVVSLGVSRDSGTAKETTTRIKFTVPITLPLHEPEPGAARKAKTLSVQPQPPVPPGPSSSPAPGQP